MTIAPMDPREAHLRVWALIESGLESNADWREMFLGYGLLATVGFEQPFDQDDEKVRELAEQLDLPADLVAGEVCYFIRQNCLWTTDELVAHMDGALQILAARGRPEDVVDCLLGYSPYAKRPQVLRALRTAVAKREDADSFHSFLPNLD
jgi:hypothetical protein